MFAETWTRSICNLLQSRKSNY